MSRTRAVFFAPVLVSSGLCVVALVTFGACTATTRDFGAGGAGGTTGTTSVVGGSSASSSSSSGSTTSSSSGSSSSSTSTSGTGGSTSSTSSSSTSGLPACVTGADCPGAPNGTAICKSDNTCGFACNSGFEDCDGNLGTNGCEADLAKDSGNCGMCGNKCFYGCLQSNCADPVDFSAGPDHACAVIATGEVRCWGNNFDGQIGNGATGGSVPLPAKVNLPGKAVQVACGGSPTSGNGHTCARLDDGNVFCWGFGSQGQLGQGTPGSSPVPVAVMNLPPMATHITAGSSHNCAIVSGGQAFCWGNNSSGQLGSGGTATTQPSAVPVQGPPMATLDAGMTFTCGVDLAGVPFCWGQGQLGKLGTGATGGQQSMPKMVSSSLFPLALGLSAGANHACAWTDSETACWGDNAKGEVGVPGPTQFPTPTPVGVIFGSVSAGTDLTVAVTQAGDVFMWGMGYLGEGSAKQVWPMPKQNGMSGVARVSVGGRLGVTAPGTTYVCALRQTGEIVCWGDNAQGQLGDGTTTTSPLPVTVKLN